MHRFMRAYPKEVINTALNVLTLIIGGILGMAWSIWIYQAGVEFSADSTQYLSFALNMYGSGDYAHSPLWPPLYSFLVSISMGLTQFPAEAASLVSGLSLLCVLITFATILHRYSNDNILNSMFLFLLFSWTSFLYIYKFAWSEGPFTAFALLGVYFIIRHIKNQKYINLIYAGIFFSLASITRYLGLVFPFILIGYALFYYLRNRDSWKVFPRVLAISILSLLPFIIIVTTNYLRTQTLFGERVPGTRTIFYNITLLMDTLVQDIPIIMGLLIIIGLALSILTFRQVKTNPELVEIQTLLILIILIYSTFVVYTTTINAVNPINTRYIAPIYPYFLLFMFFTVLPYVNKSNTISTINVSMLNAGRILFYGLVLILIFINLRNFSQFMNNIFEQRYIEPSSHFSSGFNLSRTADEIKAYLQGILDHRDSITFTAVIDYSENPPRPSMSRSIFFRKILFENPEFKNIKFENVTDDRISNFTDFDISLLQNDVHEKISYRNTRSDLENNSELFVDIRQLMDTNDIDVLFLITYSAGYNIVGRDLHKSLPSDFFIIDKIDIGYYTFYELEYHPPLDISWEEPLEIATPLMSYDHDNVIFYNSKTGLGNIIVFDDINDLMTKNTEINIGDGWDNLIHGEFGESSQYNLFAYDKSDGRGTFFHCTDLGGCSQTAPIQSLPNNFDLIVAGNFREIEVTTLFFYDTEEGYGRLYELNQYNQWIPITSTINLGTHWDLIVSGQFGGNEKTDLLFYSQEKGQAITYIVDNELNLIQFANWQNLRKSWSNIITGEFGNDAHTDLLFYDAISNQAVIYSTNGLGGLNKVREYPTSQTPWDLIVVGQFSGNKYSDILVHENLNGTNILIQPSRVFPTINFK